MVLVAAFAEVICKDEVWLWRLVLNRRTPLPARLVQMLQSPDEVHVAIKIGNEKSASVYERIASVSGRAPENRKSDPKPENETVSKLRIASWIWFSGRRRRRYARETTQRRPDSLCLAAGRRRQEGQRSLSGDGGVAAGGLQLEAAIRGVGIERAARVAATARRSPNDVRMAERAWPSDRSCMNSM